MIALELHSLASLNSLSMVILFPWKHTGESAVEHMLKALQTLQEVPLISAFATATADANNAVDKLVLPIAKILTLQSRNYFSQYQ
jgi:hypothetical protein